MLYYKRPATDPCIRDEARLAAMFLSVTLSRFQTIDPFPNVSAPPLLRRAPPEIKIEILFNLGRDHHLPALNSPLPPDSSHICTISNYLE